MKRLFSLGTAVVLLCLACGGGGGASSAGLTEDECRQLMKKIEDIYSEGLTSAEQAEMAETDHLDELSVQECVAGQNWNRGGFECVMEATTEGGLRNCILLN